MTAQEHIDKIGALTQEVEAQALKVKREVSDLRKLLHDLHEAQNDAQNAYNAEHGNVVLFSGGTGKPPPKDPDEPVEP